MERRVKGLTLIELLIAMAILSVTVSLSVPAFGELMRQRRLEHHSRELLGAINLARAEAIARASSVTVCPSQMWRTGEAVCGGDYTDGWIVFTNANRSSQVEPATDQVLRAYAAPADGYRILNRRGTRPVGGNINYLADGSAHRNLTLQFCPPGENTGSLSVVLNIVGRARLERDWGSCEPLS